MPISTPLALIKVISLFKYTIKISVYIMNKPRILSTITCENQSMDRDNLYEQHQAWMAKQQMELDRITLSIQREIDTGDKALTGKLNDLNECNSKNEDDQLNSSKLNTLESDKSRVYYPNTINDENCIYYPDSINDSSKYAVNNSQDPCAICSLSIDAVEAKSKFSHGGRKSKDKGETR